jgi:hypothetical protein
MIKASTLLQLTIPTAAIPMNLQIPLITKSISSM